LNLAQLSAALAQAARENALAAQNIYIELTLYKTINLIFLINFIFLFLLSWIRLTGIPGSAPISR
jgi:hypothetical protein